MLTSLADAGLLDDASPADVSAHRRRPACPRRDGLGAATSHHERQLAVSRRQAAVVVRGEGRLVSPSPESWRQRVSAGSSAPVSARCGQGHRRRLPRRRCGHTTSGGRPGRHPRSVCDVKARPAAAGPQPTSPLLTDLVGAVASMIAPLHAPRVSPHLLVRIGTAPASSAHSSSQVGRLSPPLHGPSACRPGPRLAGASRSPARRSAPAAELAATQAAVGFRAAQAAADARLVADRRGRPGALEHQPGDRPRRRHQ